MGWSTCQQVGVLSILYPGERITCFFRAGGRGFSVRARAGRFVFLT